jgi:RNA polymerase sigma factor (TIGR02999 family)
MEPPSDLEATLSSLCSGDKAAIDALMPALYSELHNVAQAFLARERPDHTLQPTALVHEAYLRLIGQRNVDWSCRAQVLGLAASMMRRILVNYAEARHAQKRDGGVRVPMDDDLDRLSTGEIEIHSLDDALNRLEQLDARQARIVELRFFSGLTVEDTASVLNVSTATVKREWRTARLWLAREFAREQAKDRA